MKDEEFYSTIKIVTGEEIVAKVIYLEDEDKVMLEDPLLVEMQRSRKGALEIAGFAFKEWMSATFEDMFVLNREHIVTMSEVDPTIKEFYSTIKIVTGEEIVAKVIYLEDEDKVMLEDPLLVEVQRTRKGALEIAGFAFKEWMSATFEDMFVMNREHIVTMSEIDPTIKEFYIKTLERMKSGQTLANTADKLPRKSGYVGSVSKFKKSLEDIFKKS